MSNIDVNRLAEKISAAGPFSGEHIERGIYGLYSGNNTLVATLGNQETASFIAEALNAFPELAQAQERQALTDEA